MLQQLKKLFSNLPALPEQWAERRWWDTPFLAIDLEFTSLALEEAEILSVGWVEGKGSQINLASSFYQVAETDASLNQSPVIHGLTEADIITGQPVKQILQHLLPLADTHIWVFHNAAMDMKLIRKSCEANQLAMPSVMVFDTLKFAMHQFNRQHHPMPQDGLTLEACRHRFHLPKAPAHNALEDALATMELTWAMLSQQDPEAKQLLGDLPSLQYEH